MIFKKLELKNFKSHVDTTLKFNEGISLIVGENGAGKSSIFEAITFALFKDSQVNNIDLVRTNKGINEKIKMEVKLTFNANGTDYRVERTITKKNENQKPTAKLIRIKDDIEETLVSGVRGVDHEIEQILTMNSKTFLNAIHIRQGEISSLIDEKPAERKKLIGQLLRIDDLEKAYNEMPAITKDFELLKERLDFKIESEDELNSKLEILNEQHQKTANNIKLYNEQLERLKKKNETKTEEKEKQDQQKEKLESFKVKLNSEEKHFEILSKSKEDLTAKYDEILNNEKEMVTLKPFCNEFKELLLKFNDLKKDETLKNEKIEEIETYKTILLDEKENHDRYVELENEIKELNLKKAELNSEIKLIEKLEANKEKTEVNLKKYSKLLDILYLKCRELLSEFDVEEIDYETVSLDELDQIVESKRTSIKDEISEIDEKITDYSNTISSLQQEIKSTKKPLVEIKKVDNKCPTCQSDISEDKKDQLINTYEVTISDNTKKINETNELIKDIKKTKLLKNDQLNKLESIKNNINKNKHVPEHITKFTKEVEDINENLDELNIKKEKINEFSESIEQKNTEFKNLETSYKNYEDADTLLKNQDDEEEIKNQLNAISDNKKEIEKQLNDLLGKDHTLSFDISNEELNNQINDLKDKDKKYNILKGSVKYKEEYEKKINENEQEIKSKENIIDLIKNTIESCPYDEESHKNSIASLEETTNKINNLTREIAVHQNELKNFEKDIDEINKKVEENKKYIGKLNTTKEYLDLLYDFRQHYSKNGIQKDLRSQSKPLIQKYTHKFFDKFNFNYSGLILSDEYDISIYGPDGKVKLDMVSGGEKIAIALSLRLAITQVMSKGNIETILLDEPTIHLDSFRRQELINVLRSMSVIPQMIIVTHDTELETAADTLIKIKKEDGISKVSDD